MALGFNVLHLLQSRGEAIGPLSAMFWRGNNLVRLLFLVNEFDLANGTLKAKDLMTFFCSHLGDTAIIENSHQQMKDTVCGFELDVQGCWRTRSIFKRCVLHL